MYWISSIFMCEEDTSITVVIAREGYHGRDEDLGK